MIPKTVYVSIPERLVAANEFCFEGNDQIDFHIFQDNKAAMKISQMKI